MMHLDCTQLLLDVKNGTKNLCTIIPTEDTRSSIISVAIQDNDALQKALDSGKHGKDDSVHQEFPISIEELLLGDSKKGKSQNVAIYYNSTFMNVEYIYYSKTCVKVKHLYKDFFYESNVYTIVLDKILLNLYNLDISDILKSFGDNVDCTYKGYLEHVDSISVYIDNPKGDIMLYTIRECLYGICCDSWKVIQSENSLVYTVIEGASYKNLIPLCDDIISTNINNMVKCQGIVDTYELLSKFFANENSKLIIANMMSFRGRKVSDYSNMSEDNPLKSLTISKQSEKLREVTKFTATDNLNSVESSIIIGGIIRPL